MQVLVIDFGSQNCKSSVHALRPQQPLSPYSLQSSFKASIFELIDNKVMTNGQTTSFFISNHLFFSNVATKRQKLQKSTISASDKISNIIIVYAIKWLPILLGHGWMRFSDRLQISQHLTYRVKYFNLGGLGSKIKPLDSWLLQSHLTWHGSAEVSWTKKFEKMLILIVC